MQRTIILSLETLNNLFFIIKTYCGLKSVCVVSIFIYFLYSKNNLQRRTLLSHTCPAVRVPVFYSNIQLKVFAFNVWGMPEFLGSEDKQVRMNAIGKLVAEEDYDLYLFSELWLRSDHQIIKSWLPAGFFMTEIADFSLPSCDGIISPWDCSGLAIVSRFPFLETEFHPFLETGDWQSLDGEYWAQKGVGRVRIEPSHGFTTDVFVTHTCAEGPSYSNEYYRQKQAEQVKQIVSDSDAIFVIVGGDLNTSPSTTTYNALGSVLVNSLQGPLITLAKVLDAERATYGNPQNYYSRGSLPVVYDYVWFTAREGNKVWSTFTDVPVLKTEKPGTKEDNVTREISLSDHEAVIVFLKLWKLY